MTHRIQDHKIKKIRYPGIPYRAHIQKAGLKETPRAEQASKEQG